MRARFLARTRALPPREDCRSILKRLKLSWYWFDDGDIENGPPVPPSDKLYMRAGQCSGFSVVRSGKIAHDAAQEKLRTAPEEIGTPQSADSRGSRGEVTQ